MKRESLLIRDAFGIEDNSLFTALQLGIIPERNIDGENALVDSFDINNNNRLFFLFLVFFYFIFFFF